MNCYLTAQNGCTILSSEGQTLRAVSLSLQTDFEGETRQNKTDQFETRVFHRQIERVEQFPGLMYHPPERKWNKWSRMERLSKKP